MKNPVAILFLMMATRTLASPFLVCDAVPSNLDQFTKPVSYVLTGLAQSPISTPATTNSDGTVQLHYDLSGLTHGTFTVTAAAVNVFGGIGPASDPPFSFGVGVPAAPGNLRIVP